MRSDASLSSFGTVYVAPVGFRVVQGRIDPETLDPAFVENPAKEEMALSPWEVLDFPTAPEGSALSN